MSPAPPHALSLPGLATRRPRGVGERKGGLWRLLVKSGSHPNATSNDDYINTAILVAMLFQNDFNR